MIRRMVAEKGLRDFKRMHPEYDLLWRSSANAQELIGYMEERGMEPTGDNFHEVFELLKSKGRLKMKYPVLVLDGKETEITERFLDKLPAVKMRDYMEKHTTPCKQNNVGKPRGNYECVCHVVRFRQIVDAIENERYANRHYVDNRRQVNR